LKKLKNFTIKIQEIAIKIQEFTIKIKEVEKNGESGHQEAFREEDPEAPG
jgi:hypothetical protein